MVSEAVEQRGRHFWIAKDARPFAEGEVGRDDDRGALIETADEMEQQLPAGLGEGEIAEFVEDDSLPGLPQTRTLRPRRYRAVLRGWAFHPMWFNADTTAHGIEALRQYRTAYDEKTKTFSDTPNRDWTTDIADAARYMAVAAREIAPPPPPASERPPGISMAGMTMDRFMDIEDSWSRRPERV